jgi:hypothetical protein
VAGATLMRRARALTSRFDLLKIRRFFAGITTEFEMIAVTGPEVGDGSLAAANSARRRGAEDRSTVLQMEKRQQGRRRLSPQTSRVAGTWRSAFATRYDSCFCATVPGPFAKMLIRDA